MPKPRAFCRHCSWRLGVQRPRISAWRALGLRPYRKGSRAMSVHQRQESGNEKATKSIEMLKAVIDGGTYDTVAARFGVTRTAVERRIKSTATRLIKVVGIEGMNERGMTFARRLREHRVAIIDALADFVPPKPYGPRQTRVVSAEEIAQAVLRIKRRSSRPSHDQ